MMPAGSSSTADQAGSMERARARSLPLAFEILIESLRRRGFVITVDHHLRLGHLLEEFGDCCRPQDLGDLLCPIFASSAEQQSIFQQVFETLHARFDFPASGPQAALELQPAEPSSIETSKPARAPRRWPFVVAAAAVLLVVFALGTMIAVRQQIALSTELAGETQKHLLEPASPRGADPEITATEPVESISRESLQGAGKFSARWTMTALPLVVLLFFLLYRLRNRRLVLRRESASRAPLIWPLELDGSVKGPFDQEGMRLAARQLRRRLAGSLELLDLPATVRATVAAAGRVDLRYRPISREPEYLALIDRRSFGDHSARFAEELALGLAAEGLFVHRFFFENDPRICRAADGTKMTLAELRDRYAQDRLLLYSDGRGLLDPLSGRPMAWTADLFAWPDRALLTPRDPARWQLPEQILASEIVVLPCTLASVIALTDHFQGGVVAPLEQGRDRALTDRGLARQSAEDEAGELRQSLGEPTFQWLCACAVHSELQWDWTLHLATLPSMGPDLVKESSLLSLIRLPFFREGRLPGRLRWLLIRELTEDREQEVRSTLAQLLMKNPPPASSIASESRILQLKVHQAFQNRGSGRGRRQAARLLRSYSDGRRRRDEPAFRALETLGASRLDLILPRRLRQGIFAAGQSVHGLRTWPASLAALLLSLALFSVLRPSEIGFDQPSEENRATVAESSISRIAPDPLLASISGEAIPPVAEPTTSTAGELTESGSSAVQPAIEGAPETGAPALLIAEAPPELEAGPGLTTPATETPPPPSRDSGPQAQPIPTGSTPEATREPQPEPLQAAIDPDRALRPEAESLELASEELPRVVINESALSVRIDLDPTLAKQRIEVPVLVYRRPVDFYSARVVIGKTIFGRQQAFVQARLSNAGGAGHSATLKVDFLDAAGEALASKSVHEKLDIGANRIETRWKMDPLEHGALSTVVLELELEHGPTPLDTVKTFFGKEEGSTLPLLDRALVSIEDERTVLLLPREPGESRLDLFLRPIDYQRVRLTFGEKSATLAITAANPGDQDYRVRIAASLLSADGETLATKTDKRVVEEGERNKELKVRWRLSPEELAHVDSIRLVLQSEED